MMLDLSFSNFPRLTVSVGQEIVALSNCHSVLKLFTGFAIAALID